MTCLSHVVDCKIQGVGISINILIMSNCDQLSQDEVEMYSINQIGHQSIKSRVRSGAGIKLYQ